ncbi:MAG: hypothetical protein AAGF60_06220 [Pseudomonadota bacterium]
MSKSLLTSALFALALTGPCAAQEDGEAPAQTVTQEAVWGTLQGTDSADLAVSGWTLIGTTGLAAGPETGLLVTFWRANNGNMARCVFSLVSPTGSQSFETCSIATVVNVTNAAGGE